MDTSWISVSDQLPADSGGVLVYIGQPYNERAVASYDNGEWSLDSKWWQHLETYITHWMPLPSVTDL